jgi:hypothetical protein
MSAINNGGPAFPGVEYKQPAGGGSHIMTLVGGMNLRDYFAAKAMQGLLANPKMSEVILKEGGAFGGWIEHSAYGWADAMLKAREGGAP